MATPKRSGKQNDIPLHEKVRRAILHRIESGELKPGDLLPPELQLCTQMKVSRITMRHALQALVNEGYLSRRPGSGTFIKRPEPAKPGQDKVVSLILTNGIGAFMIEVIRGVEAGLRERGLSLTLALANDDVKHERELISQAIQAKVGGVIIFPVDSPEAFHPNCYHYLKLQEAHIPMVFVDRYLSQLPVGYVVAADEQGMYQLTKHVINQGRSKIGYIDHAIGATSVIDRYAGFRKALSESNLPEVDRLVIDAPRGVTGDIELAYRLVKESLAKRADQFDALVTCNTYYAIGAFHALKEMGINVPKSIALAGFDDLPEAAALEVPLTVFKAPVEEMSRAAANYIADKIEQPSRAEVRKHLPGQVIARASCGEASNSASGRIGLYKGKAVNI
jgi:GntR family transcriptional regulator, arabinose operon transcriptional repressor